MLLIEKQRLGQGFGVVWCTIGGLVLCGCEVLSAPPKAVLELETCRVKKAGRMARCGWFEVLERRKERLLEPDGAVSQPILNPGDVANGGRTIRLRVVVYPARTRAASRPPLFLLAGGPGQGAVETYTSQSAALEKWGSSRDLVLVDQRGTGRSGALKCPQKAATEDWSQSLNDAPDIEQIDACIAALGEADLTQYLTPMAADDLDDVRAALGYSQIDLFGASYGTRLALVYARRYPSRVHSLVLDGVAPVNMAMPSSFPKDADLAFRTLDQDCISTCRDNFGSPVTTLERLLEAATLSTLTATLAHPRTGEQKVMELGPESIQDIVRSILYSPDLSALLPRALHEALEGRWSSLGAAGLLTSSGMTNTISMGLFLSVVCTEDIPLIDKQKMYAETDGLLFGHKMVQRLMTACERWPRGQLPKNYSKPVKSTAPTLILSGALDPVTPPHWGEYITKFLLNHQHIVVPGAGHGNLQNICILDIVEDFLNSDAQLPVKTSCVKNRKRPPFFVDFAGPSH